MIALILAAAIFTGLAIAPAHRADLHMAHVTNCPECAE